MVNDKGTPVAVYTGVNDDYTMQVQCLAKGNTDLTQWHKHPGNPVLKDVPEHLGQTQDFRDPFVWQGDSCWYMLLASNIVGVGGSSSTLSFFKLDRLGLSQSAPRRRPRTQRLQF